MRRIMVANPKGGCGKSTLAIHLASWYARCDEVVCLGDLDVQRSSQRWLARRSADLAPIQYWEMAGSAKAQPPKGCSVGIIDTPAGLHGKSLKQLLDRVDKVVVPVLPSRFDMQASEDFFGQLAEFKAVRKEQVGVAVVGMRIDPRTQSSQQLVDFLQQFDLPLVTSIRNSQGYVQAVETGKTLFDESAASARGEHARWRPLLDWVSSRG